MSSIKPQTSTSSTQNRWLDKYFIPPSGRISSLLLLWLTDAVIAMTLLVIIVLTLICWLTAQWLDYRHSIQITLPSLAMLIALRLYIWRRG